METEENGNWAKDENPLLFPSRILGLEIRGGFERLQGLWCSAV